MRGAVAAGHELTARAGADALAAGGNAVDAAVAAGVMSWATEPALTGPCGGGFLLVRQADGTARVLDAFTAIPGLDPEPGRAVRERDTVALPFDEQTVQIFHIGPATCAVPGVVAGLHAVHRRLGRLPWHDVVCPAAAAARRGVAVTPNQHAVFLAIKPVLDLTAESRALFSPDGRYVEVGTVVRQPDLANTIDWIADHPRDLYTGDLAHAVVEHQAATGGPLTAADLARYRPVWRRPLETPYRGHRLLTNPPPSSGGALVAYALAVLDGFGSELRAGGALAMRTVAEAMRATNRRRDARFERLLVRGRLARQILSDASVEAGRRAVRRALDSVPTAAAAVPSDPGTTHISTVDAEGNAVAFTASNGCHSGVIVPGTGLHLNNMMGEEDLFTGTAPAAGGRLTSMQSPSVVLGEGGGVRLVVGSSGSARLRGAITQVVMNVLDHGMHARAAVSAPRLHVEGARLETEGGHDPADLARLEDWGERLRRFESRNLYFGGANIVTIDADGAMDAAGDPRRDGGGVVLD